MDSGLEKEWEVKVCVRWLNFKVEFVSHNTWKAEYDMNVEDFLRDSRTALSPSRYAWDRQPHDYRTAHSTPHSQTIHYLYLWTETGKWLIRRSGQSYRCEHRRAIRSQEILRTSMGKGQGVQEATKGRLAELDSQRDPHYEGESACKHDHPCRLNEIWPSRRKSPFRS